MLELASPLVAGTTYQIAFHEMTWTFTFQPEQQWTPAIELNQVGYLTTAAGRHAYIGYWLGDSLAPMTLAPDETHFHVVDAATGTDVLDGEAALRLSRHAAELPLSTTT